MENRIKLEAAGNESDREELLMGMRFSFGRIKCYKAIAGSCALSIYLTLLNCSL